ncbi:hypothetical protein GGQ81_001061 [Sphingomonas desiccabilis]|nr:hypothetical protein [Sphingomonas desiccabilis]
MSRLAPCPGGTSEAEADPQWQLVPSPAQKPPLRYPPTVGRSALEPEAVVDGFAIWSGGPARAGAERQTETIDRPPNLLCKDNDS